MLPPFAMMHAVMRLLSQTVRGFTVLIVPHNCWIWSMRTCQRIHLCFGIPSMLLRRCRHSIECLCMDFIPSLSIKVTRRGLIGHTLVMLPITCHHIWVLLHLLFDLVITCFFIKSILYKISKNAFNMSTFL